MANLGILKVANREYSEAVVILEDVIRESPDNSEYYNYLGVAYQEKGNLKKAGECYLQALSLDSSYAVIHSNLGSLNLKIYLQTRDEKYYHSALSYFESAISYDPTLFAAQNGKNAALRFHSQITGQKKNQDN